MLVFSSADVFKTRIKLFWNAILVSTTFDTTFVRPDPGPNYLQNVTNRRQNSPLVRKTLRNTYCTYEIVRDCTLETYIHAPQSSGARSCLYFIDSLALGVLGTKSFVILHRRASSSESLMFAYEIKI